MPLDSVWLFHSAGGQFTKLLDRFNTALSNRYGPPKDVEDYTFTSELMTYEGQRAMFEAYRRNEYVSTGVIQWMFNNAWPSIYWHLFDWYLLPAGGYFGTKKANEPVHAIYSYDDRSIAVVNSNTSRTPVRAAHLKTRVFAIDGSVKFSRDTVIDVPSDSSMRVFYLPEPAGLSLNAAGNATYFVDLRITGAQGQSLSRNFYWLSTKPDVLSDSSTWYMTPVNSYADYTQLRQMPAATVRASALFSSSAGTGRARVTLRNTSASLAFFIRLQVTGRNGDEALPVTWDDNYVSLLPGESRVLTASYSIRALHGAPPKVVYGGWNVTRGSANTTASAGLPHISETRESKLSIVEAREDFDVLRHALEEAHGGFDRFASRAEIRARLNRHRSRMDRPVSRVEFAGILAESIAELRDGHARLELDSITANALATARVLPLRVMFENDRLFVIGNDMQGDSTIRPGFELVRIDGRPVADIVRTLLPKISPDGFIESGRRRSLARNFARYLWLYGNRDETHRVEALDNSGRAVTAVLSGIPKSSRPPAPSGGPNITLDFPRDTMVGVLRIRAFGGENFRSELDSVFRTLRTEGKRSLVLDLRGNGGGVDEYGAFLVSNFVDHPFRYFDRIHLTSIAPSFATWPPRTFTSMREGTVVDKVRGGFLVLPKLHAGVAEQMPAAEPFMGRVVVLIDGGSFSTTADVAAQLRSLNRATFVGEETGGVYDGNTSGLNALVVLPNSKHRLKVMMYGYWNAVRPAAQAGRGTLPDYPITPRVADVLRGADPALARAIDLAR